MLRKETKIEKILMMMLCIIVSLLSTVSCTKDELSFDQNNQTDDLTDVQAKIGSIEGNYEKFENLESYKNFQFESNDLYNKHQSILKKLLDYKEFPSINNEYTKDQLTGDLLYESLFINDVSLPEKFNSNKSGKISSKKELIENYRNFDNKKAYVELFFKFNRKTQKYEILLPKETYKLTFEKRNKIRYDSFKDDYWYFVKYISPEKYSELTGISLFDITNLRKITFLKENVYGVYFDFSCTFESDDKTYYIYQFPFVDNYKDYQNDSKRVFDTKELKKYIKPGTCIFVFDKPLNELDDHSVSIEGSFGHMMVVSDYYYSLPQTLNSTHINSLPNSQYGYRELDQYKQLDQNQEFIDIYELRRDMYDDNISLEDYLKRFVFVESTPFFEPYYNTKKGFYYIDGVRYTAGNDGYFREKLNKYTVIAVCNLNEGIKLNNPNLQRNFVNFCKNNVNKPYGYLPKSKENSVLFRYYCSGLVYYGYKENGLLILNENSLSEIKTFFGIIKTKWYMPRTITNSPFMYTRIWNKI